MTKITLIRPNLEWLPAYEQALAWGWSPNTDQDVSREQLLHLRQNPERFLYDLYNSPMIRLPSGRDVPRLPSPHAPTASAEEADLQPLCRPCKKACRTYVPSGCVPRLPPVQTIHRTGLTRRLLGAVDLAVDFATLGEYGLEPLPADEPCRERPGHVTSERPGWWCGSPMSSPVAAWPTGPTPPWLRRSAPDTRPGVAGFGHGRRRCTGLRSRSDGP